MSKLKKFDQYSLFAIFLIVMLVGAIFNCYSVVLANLFLLFSLLISWVFFNITKIARLTNLLYLSYLIICIILYSCFIGNTKSWPIFLVLILLDTGVFYYLRSTYRPVIDKLKKQLTQSILIGVILIGLLPVIHFLAYKVVGHKIDQDAKEYTQSIQTFLTEKENLSAEKANVMSADQSLLLLLGDKKYQDLTDYCQNLMVGQNLNHLSIVDEKGMVVARAHSPEAIGDIIKDEQINNIVMQKSGMAKGIASDFPDKFYIYGAVPLKDSNGILLGGIIAGYAVDDRLAREISSTKDVSLAFYLENGVIAKYSFDKSVLNFIGDIENIRPVDFADKAKIYQTSDKEIIGISNSKVDLTNNISGKQILKLLVVADQKYEEQIIILSEKIFWLVTMTLIFCLIILKKIISPRKRSLNSFIKFFYNPRHLLESLLRTALVLIAVSYLITSAGILSAKSFNRQLKLSEISKANKSALPAAKPALRIDLAKRIYQITDKVPLIVFFDGKSENIYSADIRLEYPAAKASFAEISFDNSVCNEVFNQNVDSINGWVEFSCQLKPGSKSGMIATVDFIPLSTGLFTVDLDNSYSFLLGDSGKDTAIRRTFDSGENLLVIGQ